MGLFPQVGVNIKIFWNHHLVILNVIGNSNAGDWKRSWTTDWRVTVQFVGYPISSIKLNISTQFRMSVLDCSYSNLSSQCTDVYVQYRFLTACVSMSRDAGSVWDLWMFNVWSIRQNPAEFVSTGQRDRQHTFTNRNFQRTSINNFQTSTWKKGCQRWSSQMVH